jgi:hypothetical protein
MLDPLIALSVASNVLQLIDFSASLVSKSYRIYKSADGALPENQTKEVVVEQLVLLNVRVESHMKQASLSATLDGDDERLRYICHKSNTISADLIADLKKLKVSGSLTKWKSVRQALKSVRKKHEIDGMVEQLDQLREQMNMQVLVSLR